jgi:hypothetical protein
VFFFLFPLLPLLLHQFLDVVVVVVVLVLVVVVESSFLQIDEVVLAYFVEEKVNVVVVVEVL